MKFKPTEKDNFPKNPGVYRMINEDHTIIYIGKAKNLKNRLTTYFDSSKKSPRILLMVSEVIYIEVTTTASENDALVLEQKLINKIKPKYNIIFRDDKSYPFIALSKHAFPKLYITREKHINLKKEDLFGPYPRADEAYRNVEFIQTIFKLRTCKDNDFAHRSRPCILHSIGKCSAPCVGQKNAQTIAAYKSDVEHAKNILKGQIKPTLSLLKKQMEEQVEQLAFEQAARTRDIITSLQDLNNNQTIYSVKEDNVMVFNYYQSETSFYLGYALVIDGIPNKIFNQEVKSELKQYELSELMKNYIESEVSIQGLLNIISPVEMEEMFYPYHYTHFSSKQKSWLSLVHSNLELVAKEAQRKALHADKTRTQTQEVFTFEIESLECIDISHHSGEATYGGKIRWRFDEDKGNYDKPWYRLARFDDHEVNDILHMGQSIAKIYHTEADLPDILIIDGGEEQLDAAYQSLFGQGIHKPFILMSSSKGVSRKKGEEVFFIHRMSLPLVNEEYLSGNVLTLDYNHPTRLLIQKLQDAAHDFSNSARRKQMEKTRFKDNQTLMQEKKRKTGQKVNKKVEKNVE